MNWKCWLKHDWETIGGAVIFPRLFHMARNVNKVCIRCGKKHPGADMAMKMSREHMDNFNSRVKLAKEMWSK